MKTHKFLTGPSVLNMLPSAGSWYSISNKAAPRAEVWIYDDIGYFGVTAADFSRELAEIDADEILVHLASLGGDVFDGIAVYNTLRTHDAKVTVQIDSLAASIASVIAQAGDERVMITGSQMMIHDAWGLAVGRADDLRDYADILDKQSANIAGIYAERAGDGRKKAHFASLMSQETWLTPAEAISEGLADSILKPEPAAKVTSNASREDATGIADMVGFLTSASEIGAI